MPRMIQMTDTLYHYLNAVGVRETPVQTALRKATASHPHGGMQISPDQAQLMALITQISAAQRAIEIGVFTGYSALAVAQALPEHGQLIACDINSEYTDIAQQYWQQAGVAERIDLRIAPATNTLAQLISEGQQEQFDLAFIDADKTGYDGYYEQCLTLIRTGGLIIIDNVLWGGQVANPNNQTEDTLALRTLNKKIHEDQRVDVVILPISDGVTIARKR